MVDTDELDCIFPALAGNFVTATETAPGNALWHKKARPYYGSGPYQSLLASALKWLLKASAAALVSAMDLLVPLVLGVEGTGPSFDAVRVCRTCSFPASKSTSSHLNPNNSPCLKPVCIAIT